MSACPQSLLDHFAQDVTSICHCWRLSRKDGHVTGFTDHDRSLAVDGTVFEPETGLSASEARQSLGLSVDTVDIEGALSSDRIRDEDIAAGLYDGAAVETFLVNWRRPEEFALVRTATVGKITRADGRFVAELESLVHRLDQPNGRYVTRKCDAELGDGRCGVDLGQPVFNGAGAVEAVEGPDMLRVSGLGGIETGWFSFGTLLDERCAAGAHGAHRRPSSGRGIGRVDSAGGRRAADRCRGCVCPRGRLRPFLRDLQGEIRQCLELPWLSASARQ